MVIHIPYALKWKLDNGKLVRTQLNQTRADLHYGIALMVLTKAIPILTLIITNSLLIKAVNKAVNQRKQLMSLQSKQVSQ